MPLDPKQLPRDVVTLQKIVLDLAEQLDRSLTEQNKYQNLLRELLEAQHARKSEQLSKEQLPCFRSRVEGGGQSSSDSDDSDDDLGRPTADASGNCPAEKKRADGGRLARPLKARARSCMICRKPRSTVLLRPDLRPDRGRNQRTLRIHSGVD